MATTDSIVAVNSLVVELVVSQSYGPSNWPDSMDDRRGEQIFMHLHF